MKPGDDKERVRRVVLIVLVSGVTLLFLWVVREFLLSLLLAALLAGMLQPAYRRLRERLGNRKNLAAGVLVGLLVILCIAPLAALATMAGVQAASLAKAANPFVRQWLADGEVVHRLAERYPRLSFVREYEGPLTAKLGELGGQAGTAVVGAFTRAAGETLTFFFLLFILLYATFYFLVDGRATLRKVLYYSPLPPADEDRIVGRFLSVARATVKGTLIVGIVQGTLGGLGLWVAGIGGAVFWGASMTVLSVIPSLGTALIWVPSVVYLFAIGRSLAAVLLLVWCMLAVSTIDNFLRPALVGKDTQMPDLLILISTLGGIVVFGIPGFVIGPLIASMLVTVWEIYGEVFRDVLPESPPLSQSSELPATPPSDG